MAAQVVLANVWAPGVRPWGPMGVGLAVADLPENPARSDIGPSKLVETGLPAQAGRAAAIAARVVVDPGDLGGDGLGPEESVPSPTGPGETGSLPQADPICSNDRSLSFAN